MFVSIRGDHKLLHKTLLQENSRMFLNFQHSGNSSVGGMQFLMVSIIFFVSGAGLALNFGAGQHFHSNMESLSGIIYQTEWYRYPQSVRRFMPMVILRAQQRFHLSAYGVMKLNLGNFVNVGGFSIDPPGGNELHIRKSLSKFC